MLTHHLRMLSLALCAPVMLSSAAGAATLQLALAQTELRLYASESRYAAHMARQVALAMEHDPPPQLILFPEDIGLPLALIEDYALIHNCSTVSEAMTAVMHTHAATLGREMSEGNLSPGRTFINSRLEYITRVYKETFSTLAQRHGVYIAAGSAPLALESGSPGNVAWLFGPDGEVAGRTAKVHLVPLEGPQGLDLAAAPAEALDVWHTPLGPLGMLVCADAWAPALAARLKERGARVLLNCLANPEPWSAGQEQGMVASLPQRVTETGLPGAQCFAVGRIFELEFNGRSQLLLPCTQNGYKTVAAANTADKEEIIRGELPL